MGTMQQEAELTSREAILVEDAHIRPMMGFEILEPLPSRTVPYAQVDPFILVHEARFRLSELQDVDTKHPHRGFDNLWYILQGSASGKAREEGVGDGPGRSGRGLRKAGAERTAASQWSRYGPSGGSVRVQQLTRSLAPPVAFWSSSRVSSRASLRPRIRPVWVSFFFCLFILSPFSSGRGLEDHAPIRRGAASRTRRDRSIRKPLRPCNFRC